MTKSIFVLCALALVAPAAAVAAPGEEFACQRDMLDPELALQRLEWARTCALTNNTNGPGSWFSSTRAFDMTFSWAREYRENNPNHAYSGNLNSFDINYYYAWARYQPTPVYTVVMDSAGFWKWVGSAPRPRTLFPTFESSPSASIGVPLMPLPSLPGDCKLYARDGNGNLFPWTGNVYVVAYCESSP